MKALNAKGCANWSRKEIDDLQPFAARYGGKGLAWIQVKEGEMARPDREVFQAEENRGGDANKWAWKTET